MLCAGHVSELSPAGALRVLQFYTGPAKVELPPAKQPSSHFKGVTQHRRQAAGAAVPFLLQQTTADVKRTCVRFRTRRWEAHLWVEGKQLYLGGYLAECEAALAYDLAALKLRGTSAQLNFELANYSRELVAYEQVHACMLMSSHMSITAY